MLKRYLLDRLFIKQPRLRRFITRVVYGNRDRTIQLLGSRLKINTLRENGYYRAFKLAERSSLLLDELPVLLSVASLVGRSDGFIDIGANVGVFSTVVARVARIHQIGYPIHAFEVDPLTFQRLKANADEHGFLAINSGVSAEVCEATFVRGAVSHVTTLREKGNAYSILGEEFTAHCAPLDHYEIAGNSLIIKIDVEGQELAVLRGCERMLRDERVMAIYIDGYEDNSVLSLLAGYGFSFRDGRSLDVTDGNCFSLLALRGRSRPMSAIQI